MPRKGFMLIVQKLPKWQNFEKGVFSWLFVTLCMALCTPLSYQGINLELISYMHLTRFEVVLRKGFMLIGQKLPKCQDFENMCIFLTLSHCAWLCARLWLGSLYVNLIIWWCQVTDVAVSRGIPASDGSSFFCVPGYRYSLKLITFDLYLTMTHSGVVVYTLASHTGDRIPARALDTLAHPAK